MPIKRFLYYDVFITFSHRKLFNFSKNISKILKKNNIYFGIEMMKNEFIDITLSKGNISIYKPNISKNNKNGWQGCLC